MFWSSYEYNENMTTENANIVPADFVDIDRAVRKAWGADTSASAEWSQENPEEGQCAVVALLVQYGYGGVLKRALVNGVSHYWNEINGEVVDLTRAQFKGELVIEDESEREREYVLSFPATVARYELLLDRVRI